MLFLGQSGHLIEKLVGVVFGTNNGSARTQSPLIMVHLALVTHFNGDNAISNVVVQVNMILKLLKLHRAFESVFIQ